MESLFFVRKLLIYKALPVKYYILITDLITTCFKKGKKKPA